MEKLHIITRCTRPSNLQLIKESIINGGYTFDIVWHIIFDVNVLKDIDVELLGNLNSDLYRLDCQFLSSVSGAYGYDSINKIVKSIPNEISEWIYLLDDDNILHENFYQLASIIETNNKDIIVFNQYIGGKDFTGLEYRIAAIENTRVGGIDAAQYIIKRKMLSRPDGIEYSLDYCADGRLMNFLLVISEESFLFINEVYCYYNYIPNKRIFSSPRVLLIGNTNIQSLESIQYYDYESNHLNILSIDNDRKLDKILTEFNPDAIVTLGTDYNKFHKLSSKSLDIRRRWIHFDDVVPTLGGSSYYCASMYILGSEENEPLVSFFTPIYNTGDKLYRTYESVKNQTYTNWEWVLVNDSTDGGKTLKIAEDIANSDSRVKVYDFREKSKGIVGESKYRAAVLSSGKYLMELDHDDYLTEDAAKLMVRAFIEYPDCKFVYSDAAEIYENHTCIKYGDGFAFGYGTYRVEEYNGKNYDVANTCNINPLTIRHIVGVPNHFRAWDREFYHKIGGHNRRLTIADDYEILIRTFLNTRMLRIPKLLYLQYYHNSNTQNATRADIQRRVRSIRDFYNEKIKDRFQELGLKDWAYNKVSLDPMSVKSLFGEAENKVNYVMEL